MQLCSSSIKQQIYVGRQISTFLQGNFNLCRGYIAVIPWIPNFHLDLKNLDTRPLQKLTTVYPISKESFLVYSLDDLHNSSSRKSG